MSSSSSQTSNKESSQAHRSRSRRLRKRAAIHNRRILFESLELRTLLAFDFGDAPDTADGASPGTYQTLLANNGPRHDITKTQDTLFLGAGVDGEMDATPTTNASGDDQFSAGGSDDEDGVIEPAQDLQLVVGAIPTVRLRATNTTGAAATLYGWIDYDRDCVFDNATERVSITVPTGTTNGTFPLAFPAIPGTTHAGPTSARFRLSADLSAANSSGAAMGGEVEDYAAKITLGSSAIADIAKTTTNFYTFANNFDNYGGSVASLGDIDDQGLTLIAVGASGDDTGGADRGALYFQSMFSDGAIWGATTKIASSTGGGPVLADGDRFGISAATLGDLNGDGIVDLAVGAFGDDTGGTDRGAIYLLFADRSIISGTLKIASGVNGGPMLADGDHFGSSVTALGDLDGNGVPDMAVGAFLDNTGGTNRGAIYVLLMNSDGTVKSSVKIASGMNGGPMLADGDQFGSALVSLGDLDGDGVTDLAVGAAGDDTRGNACGAAYVLLLNANGAVKSSVKLASGVNGVPILPADGSFGGSLASLGDLDRDGIPDLAIGAPRDSTGGSSRGAIFIMLLNADGTAKSVGKIANHTAGGFTLQNGEQFGASIASLGDLDGDGSIDLAVGADHASAIGVDRGLVYVMHLGALSFFDFGDASMLGLGDDPRHDISTTQHTLFLGSRVDADPYFLESPNANAGDGSFFPDDVDGLLNPGQDLLLTVGSTPKVRVRATNLTDQAATLYGRIDYRLPFSWNYDSNRASVIVPAGTVNGIFTLTFPTISLGAPAGQAYAMFRLSSDPAAADPSQVAQGGEVENYPVTILLRTSDTAIAEKTKQISADVNGGPALADPSSFGRSLASLGDLDGDGVTDLAVGANLDDTGGPDRGAVFVQFMNTDGTVRRSVKIASDTDGGPPLANGDQFGVAITSLGDLDGDGVTDLAVGARYDDTGGADRGAIYVLLLNADGTVKNSTKIASNTNGGPPLANGDEFGISVTALGDLNADSVTDLAVGAGFDDTAGENRGAVHVLFLNANGSVKSNGKIASGLNGGPSLADGDCFGNSVASLADLDGDGVTDLAVGAMLDDTGGIDRGAVHVLLLNSNGTAKSSVKIASSLNGGPALGNGDYFAFSVASLGDLDGDGVTDLAVGAVGDNTGGPQRGALYELLLNDDGTVRSSAKLATGTNNGPTLSDGDGFGGAVTSLNDFDGDGATDLAVGTYRADESGTGRGTVYLLFLRPSNRRPLFDGGGDQSATDEDPQQIIPHWSFFQSPGPPTEAGQSLTYHVNLPEDQEQLFAVLPAIDANGTLTFTPRPNTFGFANISVVAQDDGGTANGGFDTSEVQTFYIQIKKPHPWHNSLHALDVTGPGGHPDGLVVAADALAVINYINFRGGGSTLPFDAKPGPPYLDTVTRGPNGFGYNFIAPDDALAVINYINSFGSGLPGPAGEGETTEAGLPMVNSVTSDLFTLLALDIAEQAVNRRRLRLWRGDN